VTAVDERMGVKLEAGMKSKEEGLIRLQESTLILGRELLHRFTRADRASISSEIRMATGVSGKALKEAVRLPSRSRRMRV